MAKGSSGNRVDGENPKIFDHQQSSGLHRHRTLYLIRHGEATHNVLEAKAQEEAKLESQELQLSEEKTVARLEEARKSVLNDPTLRDAPLTERGREQARECGMRLQGLIDQGFLHPPTEAVVSPLRRTLETCFTILESISPELKAHIREEIKERQTQYPPDTQKSRRSLFRYTQTYDRFVMDHVDEEISGCSEDIEEEVKVRESKEMLRERASGLFDLLMKMNHRHIMIVSHKGYLRELERGLLGLTDSPLFGNAELRVYRVAFTRGDRSLDSIQRVA